MQNNYKNTPKSNEPSTENAYSNYFQGGLDTVSIPYIHFRDPKKETIQNTGEVKITNSEGLSTSPLIINILAKEKEGLKRRDGLKAFPNSTITDLVGMSVDPRSQDSFAIYKKTNGSYVLARIFKENGTIVESAEFALPNNISEIRFKVITRFPSTSNNVFIFGVDESKNIYNLATTFVNGSFTPVVENKVLASAGVSGTLQVIDVEETGKRLFLLIKNGNEYRVVFGATTALNDFYIIPSSAIPTSLFSLNNSLFIGCENEVFRIDFKDNFSDSSPLSRYVNNIGVKDAYSYQIVGTYAYCYSLSAFHSLDLATRNVLSQENTIAEFIDLNVSNLSPNLTPNYCFYNASEKMIGWICKIDSEFIYKSLHVFARDIKGYSKDWTEYYKENYQKNNFILYYSIDKKSWYMNFYDKELISYQNFYIKAYNKYSETIVACKDSLYVAHRDFYLDGDEDFPVLFIPKIKNEQVLSGGLVSTHRVSISYSKNDDYIIDPTKNERSIVACQLYLGKNILRENIDNIFSSKETKIVGFTEKNVNTFMYRINTTDVAPNCIIAISSKAVETIVGILVIGNVSGRLSQ